MTLDKLSKSALKITLDKDDIEKYNICCFDPDPYTIRDVLSDLYDDIQKALDLTLDEQQIYAEIFTRKDKCLIFISCAQSRNMTSMPMGETVRPTELICDFESFEALCDMCRSIFLIYPRFISSSSLYCADSIRLILRLKSRCSGLIRLAESFSAVTKANDINKAFTDEHFDLILQKNAVEQILMYEG